MSGKKKMYLFSFATNDHKPGVITGNSIRLENAQLTAEDLTRITAQFSQGTGRPVAILSFQEIPQKEKGEYFITEGKRYPYWFTFTYGSGIVRSETTILMSEAINTETHQLIREVEKLLEKRAYTNAVVTMFHRLARE